MIYRSVEEKCHFFCFLCNKGIYFVDSCVSNYTNMRETIIVNCSLKYAYSPMHDTIQI